MEDDLMEDAIEKYRRRREQRLAKRIRTDATIGEIILEKTQAQKHSVPNDLTEQEKAQGFYFRKVNGNTIKFSSKDGQPIGGQMKALGSKAVEEMVHSAAEKQKKIGEEKREAEKANRKSENRNVPDDYRGVIPMEKVSSQGENIACTGFDERNLRYHKDQRHPKQYSHMTDEEFNRHAIKLLQKKCGKDILGYRCKDGAICRFNRLTGEIAKGYPGGKIKTCFFPTRKYSDPEKIDIEYARQYFDGIRKEEDYDR